jgi:transcriptional regulator with XRE-family HTH domain
MVDARSKNDPAGDQTAVADRIKSLRLARGWSQEDVATKMQAEGFAWLQSTLTKTESGARPIRLTEAVGLARIFEVDMGDLVRQEAHPFVTRMQRVAAETKAAQKAVQAAQENVGKSQSRLNYCKEMAELAELRFHAIQRMGDYIDNLDRDGFDAAVDALRRHAVIEDEWLDILLEIGVAAGDVEARRSERDRLIELARKRHVDYRAQQRAETARLAEEQSEPSSMIPRTRNEHGEHQAQT